MSILVLELRYSSKSVTTTATMLEQQGMVGI